MSQKRILLTGATDGIGLETARRLASLGHQLLLHGRSRSKLDCVESDLRTEFNGSVNEGYVADLSDLSAVKKLAGEVRSKHESIDVLINNAGVFMTPTPRTRDGLDVRFVVNSVSPYLLTQQLLPIIPSDGRVINLSSAAQSRVDLLALSGKVRVGDSEAYAQSKLAITMWTRSMAESLGSNAPVIVAVNPGSFLNSKMVQQAYGRPGKDLG
ncbi:MAG: SDR family NAD(P)-dependent oxidoreductase, partial [Planctomycetota bacterium]